MKMKKMWKNECNNEDEEKEEIIKGKDDEGGVLSRLTGFVTKMLNENKLKNRLSKDEALQILHEMGFDNVSLNEEMLKNSSSFQEAVCKLLDK